MQGKPNSQLATIDPPKQIEVQLDDIPDALVNVDELLLRFQGYMADCFNIKDQELAMVQETQFLSVRNEVCKQACAYNHVVAPVCQNVLADAHSFFNDFELFYEDFDDMKTGIDMLVDSSHAIAQGFEMTKKIHGPILKEATINGKKAQTVQNEMMQQDSTLRKDYDQMLQHVETLKSQAQNAKASKLWAILPIAGWVVMWKGEEKHKKLNKQAKQQDQKAKEAEEGMKHIQQVLFQVEEHLIPALNSYLSAVQDLQVIFQQFHIEATGLKKAIERTDQKIKGDAAESQMKILHNGMMKKGKKIGAACSTSINLYNQLTSEFDSLQKFHSIEMEKEMPMIQEIKQLVKNQVGDMGDQRELEQAALKWCKHMDNY